MASWSPAVGYPNGWLNHEERGPGGANGSTSNSSQFKKGELTL